MDLPHGVVVVLPLTWRYCCVCCVIFTVMGKPDPASDNIHHVLHHPRKQLRYIT